MTEYDLLVKYFNSINASGLVKKQDYDAKINELTGEIPGFIALATTVTVLNAVKNEIPNVSDLVKKTDLEKKYQILSLNMLPHLIIINSKIIYLMQR